MKKSNKQIIKYLLLFLVFATGIASGLILWNKISLPFHNPWEAVGPLTLIRFNPMNNLVRFVILISLPSLLLLALFLFRNERITGIIFAQNPPPVLSSGISAPSGKTANISLTAMLILFSLILGMNVTSPGDFDSFHEGETLGTAISYMAGQTPYEDFIFCHGVYQDPLRSVVAFSLFGKSIGAVRTLESALRLLTMVMLSLVLLKIYRGNYLLSFLSLTVLFYLHRSGALQVLIPVLPGKLTTLNYARDLTLYAFLLTIPGLGRFIAGQGRSATAFNITAFFFSFIPLASFGYSIDRAFYIFAAWLILAPLLYYFFFRNSRYNKKFLVFTLFGVSAAMAFLLVLMRGGFPEFFRFTFLIIPRYKELIDGGIFPVFQTRFLLICLLIALNTFWVTHKFIMEFQYHQRQFTVAVKSFLEVYLIEFSLLILSVFFFRSALGRTDWGHLLYVSHLTYILSIYILFRHYLIRYRWNRKGNYAVVLITVGISLFFIFRIYNKGLLSDLFPVKVSDTRFIPENYKATIAFLKRNLNPDDQFFTMTSEASWYYFLDKPCPSRFPVVWFASTNFYQEEVAGDLASKNIKFILYKNKFWSNNIDGVGNETRYPIIIRAIRQNYIFHTKIDDNEIWINKQYNGRTENKTDRQ